MDYKIEHFEKFNDQRGQLVVFLKQRELLEGAKEFGQIYFVTFEKDGAVRGNHYHTQLREWFGVVFGKLEVVLEDIRTKERVELVLDGDSQSYVRLEIGPHVAHAFRNIGTKAALLNYTDREWNAQDSHRHMLIP